MLCATGVADIHTAGIPTRAAGHPVALRDEWPIQGCILDHASVTAGKDSINVMRMSSGMPDLQCSAPLAVQYIALVWDLHVAVWRNCQLHGRG